MLKMERETGFEPATSSLGSWHSTTELLPRSFVFRHVRMDSGAFAFSPYRPCSPSRAMGSDRKINSKPDDRNKVLNLPRDFALPLHDNLKISHHSDNRLPTLCAVSEQSRNVRFSKKYLALPFVRNCARTSLAIPLITVRPRIAAWRRQGRRSMRRRAALTAGRDAAPCIQRGMARVPTIRA